MIFKNPCKIVNVQCAQGGIPYFTDAFSVICLWVCLTFLVLTNCLFIIYLIVIYYLGVFFTSVLLGTICHLFYRHYVWIYSAPPLYMFLMLLWIQLSSILSTVKWHEIFTNIYLEIIHQALSTVYFFNWTVSKSSVPWLSSVICDWI